LGGPGECAQAQSEDSQKNVPSPCTFHFHMCTSKLKWAGTCQIRCPRWQERMQPRPPETLRKIP
jgi:hypothetical protein